MTLDLVNPHFELIDPTPDIHALFLDFNNKFFKGMLLSCEVKWSPRMTTCAGVCSFETRSKFCSIRLSKPLLTLRPRKDLVETLLHEMIHAFLFLTSKIRDRDGHGPEFLEHMHRINHMAGTRITVYHAFHAEVALYKKHWWRCTGPCKDRRPFMGYVKRASNRAPGPNDRWWAQHSASCGGTFEKIKEPEGYNQKTKSKKAVTKSPIKKPQNTLDGWVKNGKKDVVPKPEVTKIDPFTGSGTTLGGAGRGVSRLLGDPKPSTSIANSTGSRLGGSTTGVSSLLTKNWPTVKPKPPPILVEDDDIIIIDDPVVKQENKVPNNQQQQGADELLTDTVICPSCNDEVNVNFLNDHLDYCLG